MLQISILILAILALGAVLFLLLRLRSLRREMQRMSRQVRQFTSGETGSKVTLDYSVPALEELAAEVNRLADRVIEAGALQIRTENELKQAVANISHDIRTPLTSIFGYLQLLEDAGLTDEQRQSYLDIIKKRTDRLHALLNDFFELSVIESPDYELRSEPVRLNQTLQEVLFSLYDQFEERGITPELQLPGQELTLYTDPSAIRRVMENLLLNTIRHSGGGVAVSLLAVEGIRPPTGGSASAPGRAQRPAGIQGAGIRLTIENDAPELSAEDVHQLFDRFYTADKTRSGKGTGLGLSIVRSLMEKMGGQLRAELRDGRLRMICEWRA